jgi:MATE family multidrug resistance protein
MNENFQDINDLESTDLLTKNFEKYKNHLLAQSPEEAAKYLNDNSDPDELQIWVVLKNIINTALPTILFYGTLFGMQSINLIFISHSSDQSKITEVLNGMGISHLFVNCLLLSISTGIVSGFGTLGAKAYGAKMYYLMGLYLHRAQITGFILTLSLIIFFYFYALKIISLMGVESEVLVHIKEYLRIMMIYVIFEVQFWLNMQYLNIINKSHIIYIIFFTTLVFHPIMCYYLIIYHDLGLKAAGLSLIVSQMLNSLQGSIYIYVFRPLPESIFFFNIDSFKGLWNYLKVAFPMTIILCADVWEYEIMSIVALWISKTDYTIHIILANFVLLTWSLSSGLATTSTIITGREICRTGVKTLKKYILIFFIFSILLMIILDIIILSLKKHILLMYVNIESILLIGEQIIPLICIMNIFSTVQFVLSGICRGIGKEFLASTISIPLYVIVLTCLACLFGKWMGWGVYGIWFAIMLNDILSTLTFSFFIFFYFDYHKIQLNVLKKLQTDYHVISALQNLKNIEKFDAK